MYKNKIISIIIPAYREEELIGKTIELVPNYADKVYVIDDGSPDRTYEVALKYAEKDPRIVIIKHPVNKGVGAGIVTGYKKSLEDGIDIAVIMAGDNQMDPVHIPSLLDPIIDNKADYTKGNRLTSLKYMKGMSLFRRFGNFILTLLTKLSSGYWKIMDPQNGFTAINCKILPKINIDKIYPSYGYCNDLLAKLNVYNFRVMDIEIPARYGNEKSKIRYGRYIFNVSKLLLNNFIWRIKEKYVIINPSPIAFLYYFGVFLTTSGIVLVFLTGFFKIFQRNQIISGELISFGIIVTGITSFISAVFFDNKNNSRALMR